MAETLDELKAVLTETLEARGMLGKLRAQVRANVYQILDETSDTAARGEDLCDENLFINELIREYLHWNGYLNTLSVFHPETGQPDTPPFDRNFSTAQLHIRESEASKRLPLLYSVIDILKGGPRALKVARASSELKTDQNKDEEIVKGGFGKQRNTLSDRGINFSPLNIENDARGQARADTRLRLASERQTQKDSQNRNRGGSRN